MRFAFTESQLDFRDGLAALLAKECPPERVRDAWTNETGRSGTWAALAEMGVVGLTAPAANGGLGMAETDLVLLLEETGRACLAEPIVETTAVAVPALAEAESPRLADLVEGRATATVLDTRSDLVVWADSADVVIALRDDGIHLEKIQACGLVPQRSVDGSRRLARLSGEWSDDTRIGDEHAAALAFDRGALSTAAQLIGLGRWMLDTAVAYAGEREQFGAKIGTFQAVKHHLANARLALEFAAPLVYRAAESVAQDREHRDVHVSLAKATASDAAETVARVALQCHGAIGYTTEYDLHLYLKRTWALARSWGDARSHRRRIAATVLDPDLDPRDI